jgi:hypothetical protein
MSTHDTTSPIVGDRADRTVAALILVAMLAACSNDGSTAGDAEGDRSPGITGPTATAEPSASASPTPAIITVERFETPSGNIHCQSFTSSLLCVIDSGLVPEPSHDFCPVDWLGLFVQVGEYAGPSCAGGEEVDRTNARVFPYGRTWERGGVTCRSERSGLTCQDEAGNGFTLARAGWELLGKESAARAAFGELRKQVRSQARDDFGPELSTVHSPTLRGGDDCDGLQQAFVDLLLTDGTPVIYEACFVSGTWHLTDGPLFPD